MSKQIVMGREEAIALAVTYFSNTEIDAKEWWSEERLFCAVIQYPYSETTIDVLGALAPFVDLNKQIPVSFSSTLPMVADRWTELETAILADTDGRLHLKMPRPATLSILAHYEPSWDAFLAPLLPNGIDPIIGYDETGAPLGMLEMALLDGRLYRSDQISRSVFLGDASSTRSLVARVEDRFEFLELAKPIEESWSVDLTVFNTSYLVSTLAKRSVELGCSNAAVWIRAIDCVQPRPGSEKQGPFGFFANGMYPASLLEPCEFQVLDAIADSLPTGYQSLLHEGCKAGHPELVKYALQHGAHPSVLTDGLSPLQVVSQLAFDPDNQLDDCMEACARIIQAALARQRAQEAIVEIDAHRHEGVAP